MGQIVGGLEVVYERENCQRRTLYMCFSLHICMHVFAQDLRVACPNRASLALYKCNDKANVTLELCVAMLGLRS